MKPRTMTVALFLAVVWTRSAPASELLTAAVAASEVISAELANMVADAKLDRIDEKKADKVRQQIANARSKYVEAMEELNAKIQRLEVNPEKNRALLEQLRDVQKNADQAHEDLKRLSSYVNDREKLLAQLRTGKLDEKIKRAAQVMREGIASIEKVEKELGNTGTGGTERKQGEGILGFVMIEDIIVHEGELDILLPSFRAGEGEIYTPVRKGRKYVLRTRPLTLHLSLRDHQKKVLVKSRDNKIGIVPKDNDVWFQDPSAEWLLDHRFIYRRGKMSSVWTAKESYTFKITSEERDRTAELVRGLQQKSLDGATEAKNGDKVEIDLGRLPVNRLKFEVTGESLGWNRETTDLSGKVTTATVKPLNPRARITLILSVHPNN